MSDDRRKPMYPGDMGEVTLDDVLKASAEKRKREKDVSQLVHESQIEQVEDEFDKLMREESGLDPVMLKQEQGIVMEEHATEEMTVVATPPPGPRTSKQRMRLTHARKLEDKVDQLPMIGGEYGLYACDKPVCVKLWQARGQDKVKPWWAVDALVRFRDEGVCQVCHEVCGRHAEVVRRKPPIEGGEFNEYNCILICKACAEVWSKKNFYTSQSEELDIYRQYFYVLKRRAFGKRGATPLGVKGMARYREVINRMETSKIRMEQELESLKRTVGKEIVRRRMTEDEYMEMIHNFGKKKPEPQVDTPSSEDEEGRWVDVEK